MKHLGMGSHVIMHNVKLSGANPTEHMIVGKGKEKDFLLSA